MDRDMGAGLSCLFQVVVFSGYYLVAFLLGSRIMIVAPVALAVLGVIWALVRARLEGESRPSGRGRAQGGR